MTQESQENQESRSAATSTTRATGKKTRLLGISCISNIMVGGKKFEHDILDIELHQYIDRHHRLRVVILESGEIVARNLIDYSEFLGKSISLSIQPSGGVVADDRSLTFIGVVTKINQTSNINAANVTTIEAHSPTIAMDGALKNVSYTDLDSSSIIKSIIGKHSITPGTVGTGTKSPFRVQFRETDFEFIMRLASGAGLFAHYDGQKFHASKPASGGAEVLVWRETLGAFSIGLGTAPLNYHAAVYNYEQSNSYAQKSQNFAAGNSLSKLSKASPDASEKIYKGSSFSAVAKVVSDARSLDDTLKREKYRATGQMITGSGQSTVPAITVGQCILIQGLDSVDGHYMVSTITHQVSATSGYNNTFTCRPLDTAYPTAYSALTPASHLQTAIVQQNDDPDKLGRVKVAFPWLEGEETPWIRLVTPHAGADRGWYAIPEIGDEVLVGYEFGSPDHPIVIGALYNKTSAPPADVFDSEDNVKQFRTKSGNQIRFIDEDGKEEISITTKEGENKIVLEMNGPSITIESKGDISIKGANITLESDQDIKLKAGANADVEASANLTLKASGPLKAEGATVTVKGNPINLN